MKPLSDSLVHPRRALLRCFTLLLVGLALLAAGCATREQVAAIVAESNASMISSQLGGLAQKSGDPSTPNWQSASEQIETFIAAHPDQKAVTAPLRIRQAMLLLANKQTSLARAAFDSVTDGDLYTDRDRALKQHAATLVWWFSNSASDTWSAADQTEAARALAALGQVHVDLAKSPDIRDYLAEMRAWIGLAAAKQTTDEAEARRRLVDALDTYAKIFSPEEFPLLAAGTASLPDLKALTSDVRRRVRAAAVLAAARKQNHDDSLQAHPSNATFDRIVNP